MDKYKQIRQIFLEEYARRDPETGELDPKEVWPRDNEFPIPDKDWVNKRSMKIAFHKQIKPLIPGRFTGKATANQWAAFCTRSKEV